MSDSLPLHVQTAAALGWSEMYDRGDGLWLGKNPDSGLVLEVPPYGRSWCASGPLLDRILGTVGHEPRSKSWTATANGQDVAFGKSAPEAICRLVVKLHSEGKLVKK